MRLTNIDTSSPNRNVGISTSRSWSIVVMSSSSTTAVMINPASQPTKPENSARSQPRRTPRIRPPNHPTTMMNGTP